MSVDLLSLLNVKFLNSSFELSFRLLSLSVHIIELISPSIELVLCHLFMIHSLMFFFLFLELSGKFIDLAEVLAL